jgi:hypothetical protein
MTRKEDRAVMSMNFSYISNLKTEKLNMMLPHEKMAEVSAAPRLGWLVI